MLAAIDRAGAEQGAAAIVLQGAGTTFATGPDLSAIDDTGAAPSLSDLCRRVELSPLPVVAALQGPVLGGGAELALAAHYRVASAGTRISGWPT